MKKCTMTYVEFRRQLGKAGVTTYQFADLIKMNPNSVTNCSKKGVVPSHWAVISALMGEMADHGLDFRATVSKIDIESKHQRGSKTKARFGRDKNKDLDLNAAKSG
jgi:hypothetical protein